MKHKLFLIFTALLFIGTLTYFGCQSQTEQIASSNSVNLGDWTTDDARDFPTRFVNADWDSLYNWMSRLSTEDFWRYRIVPDAGDNPFLDVPEDMPNRQQLIQNLCKMAIYVHQYNRNIEDPSDALRDYQDCVDGVPTGRVFLARADRNGPDWGYKLTDRTLNTGGTETLKYYLYKSGGGSGGSLIPWATPINGNTEIQTRDSVAIPDFNAYPRSQEICSITTVYVDTLWWTDTNNKYTTINQNIPVVATCYDWNNEAHSYTQNEIDGLHFYKISSALYDGTYGELRDCSYAPSHMLSTAGAVVGGTLHQMIIKNNGGTAFASEDDGLGYNDVWATLYTSTTKYANVRSHFEGTSQTNWDNCYFKVRVRPKFLLNKKIANGGTPDCSSSFSSSCNDTLHPIVLQMGNGYGVSGSLDTTIGARAQPIDISSWGNAHCFRNGNATMLLGTSCTSNWFWGMNGKSEGTSPCIENPWSTNGKIYCIVNWEWYHRTSLGGLQDDWYLYKPLYQEGVLYIIYDLVAKKVPSLC